MVSEWTGAISKKSKVQGQKVQAVIFTLSKTLITALSWIVLLLLRNIGMTFPSLLPLLFFSSVWLTVPRQFKRQDK